jgi:hypothetical protein
MVAQARLAVPTRTPFDVLKPSRGDMRSADFGLKIRTEVLISRRRLWSDRHGPLRRET